MISHQWNPIGPPPCHSKGSNSPYLVHPHPLKPPAGLRSLESWLEGLLGGLIGYGTSDLLSDVDLWIGLGTMAGAAIGAIGVGIMSALTLRAMSEWKATQHPEGQSPITQTSTEDNNE